MLPEGFQASLCCFNCSSTFQIFPVSQQAKCPCQKELLCKWFRHQATQAVIDRASSWPAGILDCSCKPALVQTLGSGQQPGCQAVQTCRLGDAASGRGVNAAATEAVETDPTSCLTALARSCTPVAFRWVP